MAGGRRAKGERREPVFGAPSSGDLRADPRDRAGGSRAQRDRASEESPRGRARTSAKSRSGGGKRRGGRGGRRSLFGRMVYWSLVLGLWAFIGVAGVIGWFAAHLPPIQSLEVPKRPPSIQIVDLNGKPLATRGDMGVAVSLDEVPKYLPQAFVAIEDRRFYHHFGIDPLGILRAVVANVLHLGVAQGGSTITQQLAKNLFLTQERTYARKMQEVILAIWLERKFTKKEILQLYLNRVYFGSGAYGIEAAAQRYFGKPARQVTLAEAAMLAGLVKSPSKLAPNRNPDGAERRARVVLAAMEDAGFISHSMEKVALAHAPRIVKPTGAGSVNYVADWVVDVLDDLIGHVDQDLVVETTIDSTLQAAAEQALVDELDKKGPKFGVEQGALVSMTPNGAVRALVGGKNYAQSQFDRAVAAKRQPGSAFKPFVYLTALEAGLTPDTVRVDGPISVKGWKPENYSKEYFGPVTLTRGLALSLNTVAVRLALEVGPKSVLRTAYRLGISSKLEPNASIALGTSEVSPIELVSAYAPFANGGIKIAPYVIERIRTPQGKVIYQRSPQSLGRVIDPRYVAMMNAMMQQTLLIGTAHKAALPGWQAAGKTGTSQEFRDAWFIGYTSQLVTGVWLGNDDSSPTKRTTGGGLPVEIWSRFMIAAHKGIPVAALPGLYGTTPRDNLEPPAPVQVSAPTEPADNRQLPPGTKSLDGWLLDKLFGSRR